MYSRLLDMFCGRRVIDFEDAASWEGPQVAYRLREEYEDEVTINDRLSALLEQTGVDHLPSLIIGAWSKACEVADAKQIVSDLVTIASRLPGLRDLFMGEMTFEESEISWINQTDMAPLLRAFPKLESFRVRGGHGLAFSRVRHEALRELAIETGGLSRATLRDVFLSELPALEHLELLLGEEHYGFDAGVEDLQPVFSGRLFPRMKFLGLMNSIIANDIAAVLVNSPIVERLESIDLSMGNLDDEGIQSLTWLAKNKILKQLNISHHYGSEAAVAALRQALPFPLIAEDRQSPDDEWRPIVHAE